MTTEPFSGRRLYTVVIGDLDDNLQDKPIIAIPR
jgi:hypothetical protein